MQAVGSVYLLNSSILAVEPSGSERHLTTVASGSFVKLASEQPDASGLIAVSVGERELKLFWVDLEQRGERIASQSA